MMQTPIPGSQRIQKPLKRTVLIGAVAFFFILSIALTALSYPFISSALYYRYDAKLKDILYSIEHNTNTDDLRECMDKVEKSDRYYWLQQFMNRMVYDFELEYLYVVVPSEQEMTNVISATGETERVAAERGLGLMEASHSYKPEKLKQYLSFWNAEGIHYFEEPSPYGRFYTGVMPLRDSAGQTLALICADVNIESLHQFILQYTLYSYLVIAVVCFLFGFIAIRFLSRKVTGPIHVLESASHEYIQKVEAAAQAHTHELISFTAPEIHTKNEVQSLSETISALAIRMKENIQEVISTEERAKKAEEEAAAQARIAKLRESVASLLTHMPAMTFSKDMQSGRYLACNQYFAEFAEKSGPEAVIGLTDYEIFDRATADQFKEDDRKAMSMDKPFVFFEDVLDAGGNSRQLQTTKLNFTDESGRLCLLGMSVDVTEVINLKKARDEAQKAYEAARLDSLTYSRVAQALSADYFNVFYVDLDTEHFIEYDSDGEGGNLAQKRVGEDFFRQIRQDALSAIHAEDQERFTKYVTRESILRSLDENDVFTLQYRRLRDGQPIHVSMKATRPKDQDRYLIIGVSSIEAQMKLQQEEERIREERLTYSRVTALSGDYLSIYTVDPETGAYSAYAKNTEASAPGRLSETGDHFFEEARRRFSSLIYPADLDRISLQFTRENVLARVQRDGFFVLEYRQMMEGQPIYVRLKAAMVQEKNGPQLIVGVTNIDAEVRRDQEYTNSLTEARNKANIDSLTGVKNQKAFEDLKTQLDRQMTEKRHMEFAIVLLDIRGLKAINDENGTEAGDRCIRESCRRICKIFEHSPVFRVGGDEFAVLVQGTDYDQLDSLIAALQASNDQARAAGGALISCGLARYQQGQNAAAVVESANENLRQNKQKL